MQLSADLKGVSEKVMQLTPPGNEKSPFGPKMVRKGRILGAFLGPKSVKINAKIDAEKISENDAKINQK